MSLLQLVPDLPVEPNGSPVEVTRRLRAPVIELTRGSLDVARRLDTRLGALVLNGLLMAQLDVGRAHVGWLAGDGDLVRGWDLPELGLGNRISWTVLAPTRIALLDAEFERRVWAVPHAMSALLARAQRTTQWVLATSLLVSSPIVEERMMLLFGLLAKRWGEAVPEGIRVDLPLTHALIARLVGARRPTVTVTMRSLQEQGLLVRRGRTSWLVRTIRPAI